MIVVGVVGGIASGKSFVTDRLKSCGAVVLDADRIGHQVLLQESVKAQIRGTWGPEVFSPDGEVDRSKLAAIVFDPDQPGQLERLERITHPPIQQKLISEIERIRAQDPGGVLVLDAAIMVKAGWHRLCDEVIFVEASESTRWQRAGRRGWSREMFHRRESRQAPIDQKRRLSTFIIDNNGTKEETERQVNRFWNRIKPNNPTDSQPV